jgi:inner membrane protein
LPTIFTHAVAALGIGTVMLPRNSGTAVWMAGVGCSILPDADVATFHFGVAYGDLLGHRGVTHSLLFAALISLVVLLAFFGNRTRDERLRIGLFLFVATASHGLLDALTNGGLGVAFFAPLSAERFFFPVQPIEVSPIGPAFFSARGLHVMRSELLWVWLPALAAASIALSWRLRPHQR